MKKRVLAGVLTLCMLAGILSFPTQMGVVMAKDTVEWEQTTAIKEGEQSLITEEYEATLFTESKKVAIKKYIGKSGDVKVPGNLNGYPVTMIGKGTFANRTDINSVTFCTGIETIEYGIFDNCSNLKKVVIPDTVTSIGEDYYIQLGVFKSCNHLESIEVDSSNTTYSSKDGVLFDKNATSIIVYPAGKKDISYQIPTGIKEISSAVFSCNAYLKTLKVSEGITKIEYCLDECSALQRLELPSTLTSLDLSGSSCENLSQVVFPSGNTTYHVVDGVVYETTGGKVAFVPGGKSGEWVLPEGVKEIPRKAFDNNTSITSVVLSDEISTIEEGALSYLYGIKAIGVENGNTRFYSEDGVLYNSENELICYPPEKETEHFSVPSKVGRIWMDAFMCPMYLKTVTISENTTKFADYDPETGYSEDIYWPCDDNVSNFVCFMVKEGSVAEQYMQEASYRYCTGHAFSQTSYTAPTCTKAGAKTYMCSKDTCKYVYTEMVAALNHTNDTTLTKATTKADGKAVTTCSRCKTQTGSVTIAKIKTISLSETEFTFDNKAKKPKVTVKDSKGKALKEGTDYTLSYDKGRKKVGKYTVKITFKGNYSGTVKKTFSIIPKGTVFKKLTPAKKAVVLEYKKQTKQTSGYQIRLSTSKKFTKKTTKTVTINKNKTTKKKVTKLKSKKKYYVQIRTYKTVKVNGKNTKLYSDWSKVKTVKTN